MLNKNELKKIIKNNTFKYMGIRGTDEKLKVGQILETSYEWDYELDLSSYETDPVELGGVCAVDVSHDNQLNDWVDEEEDIEEVIEHIEEMLEKALEYKYNHYSLIVSETKNPYDFDENDKNEIILADAEVVMIIK